MKKIWVAPEIGQVSLSETAFNESQGIVQDGQYIDYITCEPVPIYEAS